MDCRKKITIDGIEFSQQEVTLPVSAPLQKGKLIGFDFSFCKNRTTNVYDGDFYQELLAYYDSEEISFETDCDFYVSSIDLYIDLRLDKHSNFSAFDQKNKWHLNCLNELIEKNEVDTIKKWCVNDVNKREKYKDKNYLEVYDHRDLFNQIRRAVFSLSYSFSNEELLSSFKRVLISKPSYKAVSLNNHLIYKFQPHIIEREQKVYRNPSLRRQHIENTRGLNFKQECDLTDSDILINFRYTRKDCVPFGHFSPSVVKAFIEDFNVRSIYDPCGGWGHRLLGAWSIPYIYNDIDPRTKKGCEDIYTFCSKVIPSDKKFYCEDASEFTPEEEYECVFTCPPYFTREQYLYENTSTNKYPNYKDWLNIWWRGLIKSSIKPSVKIFAYVISDSYKDDMNKVLLEQGLSFYKEVPVGTNYQSHMIRNKSNRSNKESIQVFTNNY